ncbi:MAG: hypothetical protein HOK21_16605 [Rhodospirillaceae bacterium]|jgi:hypothetical protein|nr:hypothetical protein [Rhodospirillaceae bacterium]MBT4042579.1 hypothetical protein [Rhodospirillaceae bacterium]MBT4687173.1 hypothetical protein [Rhodospirillaceae bacterium]MBT5083569.1 hypothetical protein [Rhodospirillaceae bacterium]MBT5525707.1 hypothetical protein [Rhodospirillaceae bacterium]
MTGKWKGLAALVIALPLLTGCFEDSKAEILAKTEGVSDKSALTDALGKPDDISKVGPLETWTYNASNGTVAFVIAGSTVTLRTTGDKAE